MGCTAVGRRILISIAVCNFSAYTSPVFNIYITAVPSKVSTNMEALTWAPNVII